MAVERTVFEEMGVWPLMIRLPFGGGYTLWAYKASDEVLLAIGGSILLFVSEHRLRSFVIQSGACSLSGIAGYAQLRDLLLSDIGAATLTLGLEYNLAEAMAYLSDSPFDTWTLETCATVLGCLNMLWDMARTAGEQSIVDDMRGDSEIKRFLDFLTFVDEDNIGELAQFDAKEIANTLAHGLVRLESRVLLIC